MAKEIGISLSISIQKNGAGASGTLSISPDLTGELILQNVQNIGTSAEAVTLGDITTAGQVFIKNLDATNFVEVFLDSGGTQRIAKLRPGYGMYIPFEGTALYAKANTASCKIQVVASEV